MVDGKPKKTGKFKTILITTGVVAGTILVGTNYNKTYDAVKDFLTNDIAEIGIKYNEKLDNSQSTMEYKDAIALVAEKSLENLDDSTVAQVTKRRFSMMQPNYQKEIAKYFVNKIGKYKLNENLNKIKIIKQDSSDINKTWINKNLNENVIKGWYNAAFVLEDITSAHKDKNLKIFREAYISVKTNGLYTNDSLKQISMMDDSLKIKLVKSYLENILETNTSEILGKSQIDMIHYSTNKILSNNKLDEVALKSYNQLQTKYK